MKRVAILGTWKSIKMDIADDVEPLTRQVIQRGDRIITGGSPGVEYVVASESLKWDPKAEKLEIVMPMGFDLYKSHLLKSAVRHVIDKEEADNIIEQLRQLRIVSNTVVKAMKSTEFSPKALADRNIAIANVADELIAFQINDSTDVEAAIKHARKREIPVRIMHYYR